MKIDTVLEHPWILGNDQNIRMLRRKSADMGDKVLQFVAYSNTDMNRIQQNSPNSMAASKDVLAGGSGRVSPASDSGVQFDAPSLANAVVNQPKPGSFAAKLKAKQQNQLIPGEAASQGGGAGGGLFKKYQFSGEK